MTDAARRPDGDGPPLTPTVEGAWRVLSASVCGTGHLRRGQGCQDAHAWRLLPDATLVAAVADGAGSAALGGEGAAAAARAAVAHVEAYAAVAAGPAAWGSEQCRGLAAGAVAAAHDALRAEAAGRGAALRDLATTLILVIATPACVVGVQVGDGSAVLQADDAVVALTAPTRAEYLNETTFVTDPRAAADPQLAVWDGEVTHVALMSDGLQLLALSLANGAPYPPFFAPVFRFARGATDTAAANDALRDFLAGPRVTERTDDDVTLLVATRLPP